ncbi:hypothetical protein PENSPDRAFT_584567, partial [Peniophora sp. CONT]
MSPASSVTVDFGKKISIAPLREDQANWPTYKEDFVNALRARGLGKYLSGAYVRPTRFEYDSSADNAEEKAEKVDEHNAQIQELLRGTITATTWLQIRTAGTPMEMWEALKKKCTEKHVSTVENVRDAMRQVRCAEGEDPHATIELLLMYREQLAEMGRELDADDVSAPSADAHAARANPRYKGAIIDSGATEHISPKKESFTSLRSIPPMRITAAEGDSFVASHRGTLEL